MENRTRQDWNKHYSAETEAMLGLSVSETYVDAFCGRVPKSVLARHYTDFSPEKLIKIYEKASLNILA
jgi:intergrase/recombinase